MIDHHEVLAWQPPDILLTNYRMLDRLLVRPVGASTIPVVGLRAPAILVRVDRLCETPPVLWSTRRSVRSHVNFQALHWRDRNRGGGRHHVPIAACLLLGGIVCALDRMQWLLTKYESS